MTKWAALPGALLLAALFLIVNRAAYRGYFQDDELDNLAWAPGTEDARFVQGILTPRFEENNFRPVGHFYFAAAGRMFDLDFPKYVAVLQAFHLLNVALLWMVARRLRAPPLAAFLGCVFFAFHMALFDDFWKPMYAFDVLCGTFCLLAVLFWTQRRWALSFVAFWLAYKSKELAVMMPLALACGEYWLGKRSWKPLIPFFAASLSFGLQGLFLNPNKDNDYTFRFTFDAIGKTATYYAGRIFLIPYLGFLAPLAAIPGRNRRTWFGLAMAAFLFIPLLFLPGRLFSAYCYVPFIGLGIALSGLAEAVGPIPVAVFLLLFAPLDLHELRARRGATLALDNDIRAWVDGLAKFARTTPSVEGAVWSGEIPGFADWGMRGAAGYLFHNPEIKMAAATDPAGRELLRHEHVALIDWDPMEHRSVVTLNQVNAPDQPYLDFSRFQQVWQLGDGWFDLERGFRWTAPVAFVHLLRPTGARQFSVRLMLNPERLKATGPVTLRVWLGQTLLEPRTLSATGWQTVSWDAPAAESGTVQVKLQADPPYKPATEDRTLGLAVSGLGFAAPATATPGGNH